MRISQIVFERLVAAELHRFEHLTRAVANRDRERLFLGCGKINILRPYLPPGIHRRYPVDRIQLSVQGVCLNQATD